MQPDGMQLAPCLDDTRSQSWPDDAVRPEPRLAQTPATSREALGRILLRHGSIQPDALRKSLQIQALHGGYLGEILQMQGNLDAEHLARALAEQFKAPVFNQSLPPLDPRLMDRFGIRDCLAAETLPWAHAGGVTLVVTARPDRFIDIRTKLEDHFGPIIMIVSTRDLIVNTILKNRASRLRLWAESCVPETRSCRTLWAKGAGRMIGLAMLCCLGIVLLAPRMFFAMCTILALGLLTINALLRLAAVIAAPTLTRTRSTPAHKPVVTILVPLYGEPRVVPRLINRLSRLTWPQSLLDILLVVEEDDLPTRSALRATELPGWMRVIPVPTSPLRTKPRALNYATCFARGTIIGVYDAEDAPAPDQIHRVIDAFERGGSRLACVQGMLDFYNPRSTILTRLFTIDYAIWFRVILPGFEKLGLVVPLGGTTLFFRREILEELGGWDAHNVTEDADLGIRLARHGYRTAIVESTTLEEANAHMLPFIRQRSRWLKGYAITWMVHMRNPAQLLRDLGLWRFAGLQILLLGTILSALLAPVLWALWPSILGYANPLGTFFDNRIVLGAVALCLLAEVATVTTGLIALRARHHRHLRKWLPAMHLFFPLVVLAMYKGLWEMLRAPFYWDKTAHGDYLAELDAIEVRRDG